MKRKFFLKKKKKKKKNSLSVTYIYIYIARNVVHFGGRSPPVTTTVCIYIIYTIQF